LSYLDKEYPWILKRLRSFRLGNLPPILRNCVLF